MLRLLFLCSGNGGTARIIYNYLYSIDPKSVSLTVLADRKCGACALASQCPAIDVIVSNKNEFDNDLISFYVKHKPDFVITNVHRIIPPETCDLIGLRLINVHYSILPSFPGLIGKNTVHYALKSGVKMLGASCHHVTKNLDSGPLISQAAFISTGLSGIQAMHMAFFCGCLTLLNSMLDVDLLDRSNSVTFCNRQIIYNGSSDHVRLLSEIIGESCSN